MQDSSRIIQEINTLQDSYGMTIPESFIRFLKERNKFDFSGKEIAYPNGELEFNSFLLSKTNDIQDSILKWYILGCEGREDFLTFAFGGGNDEIAIKVLGGDLGGIYHIYHKNDEDLAIVLMYTNWQEFEKQLKKQ